jgi:hypothetical protein
VDGWAEALKITNLSILFPLFELWVGENVLKRLFLAVLERLQQRRFFDG